MDRLVAKGDRTSTGGWVISASSMMFDGGKQIASKGDHATCGKCEGSFQIYGTATTWLDGGTPMVKDRDRVMCPCGQNYVLAGPGVALFIGDRADSRQSSASIRSTAEGSAQVSALFNDRFQLVSGDTEAPLAGIEYAIVRESGAIEHGTTDANGCTHLLSSTESSEIVEIFM